MPRDARLEAGGVSLRPLREADLDDMVAGLNDWEVARFLARVPFPYTRSDAEAFLRLVRRGGADGTEATLVIDLGGKAIGCMGLAGVGKANEFGYWLARAHWGKGIATEVGRAFLGHCFETFGLSAIHSGVFADNPASLRVQEKLGFVVTGSSLRRSLARGADVAHIDTILTRKRFAEAMLA
jgi:RimJ/RimL family protein N-acetyltransferase